MVQTQSIMTRSRLTIRAGTPAEVLLAFFRLGLTSFGGPTAHLGYFHEEFVTRRRWVTEAEYGELIAISQFLPGPGSSQVGYALGKIRAGYLGAFCAWLGFTAPSAAILVAAAYGLPLMESRLGAAALAGLSAVAVAVVAFAVWGMARAMTPDARRIGIAACGAVLALTVDGAFGQVAAIAAGAVLGRFVCRTPRAAPPPAAAPFLGVSRRVGMWCLVAAGALVGVLPVAAALTQDSLVRIADACVRAGALVFGGGHVLLPLLHSEPLISDGMSTETFLAGYSVAQAIPGPLFTLAGYLGAVLQPGPLGFVAAAIALIAVFLPGILLLLGIAPFWDSVRRRTWASSVIAGMNSSVVGVLAAALVVPIAPTGITSVPAAIVAVGALIALGARVPPWLVVLLGAGAGVLTESFGNAHSFVASHDAESPAMAGLSLWRG